MSKEIIENILAQVEVIQARKAQLTEAIDSLKKEQELLEKKLSDNFPIPIPSLIWIRGEMITINKGTEVRASIPEWRTEESKPEERAKWYLNNVTKYGEGYRQANGSLTVYLSDIKEGAIVFANPQPFTF